MNVLRFEHLPVCNLYTQSTRKEEASEVEMLCQYNRHAIITPHSPFTEQDSEECSKAGYGLQYVHQDADMNALTGMSRRIWSSMPSTHLMWPVTASERAILFLVKTVEETMDPSEHPHFIKESSMRPSPKSASSTIQGLNI